MKRNKEKGTSLIEAAILIPLFIFILGGIIDVARWFNLHLQVSRIAYEGARFGASLSGMNRYTVNIENEGNFNPNNIGDAVDGQIYSRIDVMRDHKNIDKNTFKAIAYRKLIPDNAIGDVVRVEITTPYTPFFTGFLFDKDIKIVAQAPYLYRNT